jgi:hypothetical protein
LTPQLLKTGVANALLSVLNQYKQTSKLPPNGKRSKGKLPQPETKKKEKRSRVKEVNILELQKA